MRLEVRAHAWKKETGSGNRCARYPGGPERPARFEAIAVEPEPRDGSGDREHDPDSRVGQDRNDERRVQQQRSPQADASEEPEAERHRGGGQQRELVPVPERIPQSREPSVIAVEARDHLCDERPRE